MNDFNVSDDSVLFITLDSCRYDTFVAASTPNFDLVAATYKAQAPSHFTYGSHAAMFIGFTPGVAGVKKPYLNPKYARLFRLHRVGWPGLSTPGFQIEGCDIVDGFRNAGYTTLGTGAMGWFDPAHSVSNSLIRGFRDFFYAGNRGVEAQAQWIRDGILKSSDAGRPGGVKCFAFMNIGETHVPYYFHGAPWSEADNPCVPFQEVDRRDECRVRQRLCLEFVDRKMQSLIRSFLHATIVVCADHGDCWGEDGLWEHGISHDMTLTVPLLIRHKGQPV